MTVAVINDYWKEKKLEVYGYTAVHNCYCYIRIKPRVVTFKERQQGSSDPTSGWAIARDKCFKQLQLLRQCEVDSDDTMFDADQDADGNLSE